jgi:uncharacterized cupredoxin-like copper-binding protein
MVVGARRTITALAILGAISLVAAACGGGGGNKVSVTEKDFSISLDSSSIKSGEVTFDITNDGPSAHEFVVFQTDLAPEALPTGEENGVPIVEEAGAEGLTLVDEAEDISPNSSVELKVTLQPGSYVAICNIPGHYAQGMHTGFTVTG